MQRTEQEQEDGESSLNLEDPQSGRRDSFIDFGEAGDDIKSWLDRGHQLAIQASAKEKINIRDQMEEVKDEDERYSRPAYDISIDVDGLSDEVGRINSEEFNQIYDAIEDAILNCVEPGSEFVYPEEEFGNTHLYEGLGSASFTGSLDAFERAYHHAMDESLVRNELGNYVSIQKRDLEDSQR
jgi:hypothetical protein